MADCPKCPYVGLQHLSTPQGVEVDECPECGGRWFDAGELEAVSADPGRLRGALELADDERPSDRPCARCSEPLTNRALLSRFLRVDYCPRCRGFWVDKTELHLVDKLLAQ